MPLLCMICPARLDVAAIFPELSFFFRTIPRHDLTSHITNTVGMPLPSRTPHSGNRNRETETGTQLILILAASSFLLPSSFLLRRWSRRRRSFWYNVCDGHGPSETSGCPRSPFRKHSQPGGTRSPSRPWRARDRHRARPAGRPAHSRAHRPAKPSLAPAAGDRGAQGRTG